MRLLNARHILAQPIRERLVIALGPYGELETVSPFTIYQVHVCPFLAQELHDVGLPSSAGQHQWTAPLEIVLLFLFSVVAHSQS